MGIIETLIIVCATAVVVWVLARIGNSRQAARTMLLQTENDALKRRNGDLADFLIGKAHAYEDTDFRKQAGLEISPRTLADEYGYKRHAVHLVGEGVRVTSELPQKAIHLRPLMAIHRNLNRFHTLYLFGVLFLRFHHAEEILPVFLPKRQV